MKLTIKDQPRAEQGPEVELHLEYGDNGYVIVRAGLYGLATFKADGTLHLWASVPAKLGFQLSADGRIKLS